jgi:hypothetical protein
LQNYIIGDVNGITKKSSGLSGKEVFNATPKFFVTTISFLTPAWQSRVKSLEYIYVSDSPEGE